MSYVDLAKQLAAALWVLTDNAAMTSSSDPCFGARYVAADCQKVTVGPVILSESCKNVFKKDVQKCTDLLIATWQSPWRAQVRDAMRAMVDAGEAGLLAQLVGATAQLVSMATTYDPPFSNKPRTSFDIEKIRSYLREDRDFVESEIAAKNKLATQLSFAQKVVPLIPKEVVQDFFTPLKSIPVPKPEAIDVITGQAAQVSSDPVLVTIDKSAHGYGYRLVTPEVAAVVLAQLGQAAAVSKNEVTLGGRSFVAHGVSVAQGPSFGAMISSAIADDQGIVVATSDSLGVFGEAAVVFTRDVRVASVVTNAGPLNAVLREPASGWPAPALASMGEHKGLWLLLAGAAVVGVGGALYAATHRRKGAA